LVKCSEVLKMWYARREREAGEWRVQSRRTWWSLTFPVSSGVGTEERSCSVALRAVKGEGRGRGHPLALVVGPDPCGLDEPRLMGLYFIGRCGPSEWLTNQCFEIPKVSLSWQVVWYFL
jgi:hypothetical protein